ncbi:15571_t:CDS:1, partial [Cetraspora pellucida]
MQPQSNNQINAVRNNQPDNPKIKDINIYCLEVIETTKDNS